MKKAIVTGITGQDGAYLAKHLLDLNYEVFGTCRKDFPLKTWRLDELGISKHPKLKLVNFDLTNPDSALIAVQNCKPDEIYNLAAQSFVGLSFQHPYSTGLINALGPVALLEAIRKVDTKIKFFQASSADMFGKLDQEPQSEVTPFHPQSPYGTAKLYSYWMTKIYRECYGIFACSAILYNHESPLRGMEFVTRKITDAVAKIKLGKLESLELGNLETKRDWGYAGDYVEAMHLMMQTDSPDDYILSTNSSHSVRDFVMEAFKTVGIELSFEGIGQKEVGKNKSNGKVLVKVNPNFFRPVEVDNLRGDNTKALLKLGWKPRIGFSQLVSMMVEFDVIRQSPKNCIFLEKTI